MCKWRSPRSGPRTKRDPDRQQTDLRLRLETWAVTVTFLVLMTITVSQAVSTWQ